MLLDFRFTLVRWVQMANPHGCSKRLRLNFETTQTGSSCVTTPVLPGKHNDGSEVTGKVLTKVDSPDADAIPWLLLTAASHSGSGTLAGVSTIQRIHTKGGQPPAAARCTSSNLDATSKSSYVADYYFYTPAK
jgi:hypothetical protein